LTPTFQYWPRALQEWFGKHILGHYEQVWLLDRDTVEALARIGPSITIWEERALGLTKSFVLYRERLLA
jgi:hypothetical protein